MGCPDIILIKERQIVLLLHLLQSTDLHYFVSFLRCTKNG